jgi:hypothetical protein
MKASSADGESEPRETPWPSVLKIPADEFQQSYAIAQLAVKLCQLKMEKLTAPLEKQNLDPETFLAKAWKLIQNARDHVLRPQTNAEYLVAHSGSHEAAENVVGRILSASRVPFEKLCDPKRNKGDTETIKLSDAQAGKPIEVEWKVYRGEGGERAFDNLFRKYWFDIGEKWKRGDEEIGTVQLRDTERRLRRVNFYSEAERKELAKIARKKNAWKERGEIMLKSWKQHGVPPADFLALVSSRRERDNRVENLKKKPKRKRRRQLKAR